MKKVLRYVVSAIMALLLITTFDTQMQAAGVGLKVSASSVDIGKNVTVTITFPEDVTGTVHLIFPEDLLTYSNASAEVGVSSGQIRVHVGKLSAAGSNKMTVTFKAKAAGTATVKASVIEAYNNDSLDSVDLGDASTKITIKNQTEDNELSSDYYLSKLNITAGSKKVTLSPTFNYRKTNYTATVDYDVTDVVVSVTRSSGKSEIVSITENGKVKLEVGENRIEILVKAENGKTLTYVVTITRKEKPVDDPVDPPVIPDPPTPATPDFEYGGTPLYAVETPDDKIPAYFVEKTVILSGGKEVLGLSFEKADLTVLYLENENKAGSFYIYNVEENYIYPFVKLTAEESYVIVLMPGDEEVPEGYNACTLSIEGKGVVNAYQLQTTKAVDMSEFYLVYCVNHNGTKGWYQYDSLEGTYQRFVGTVIIPGTEPDVDPGVTPDPGNPDDPDVEVPGGNTPGGDTQVNKPFNWEEYKTIIICAGVFLAAVMVIIVINIILTATRKATAGEEDDDDEDDDDDEYEYFDDKAVFKRTPHPAKEKSSEEKDTEEEELPKIDIGSVMDVPAEETPEAEESVDTTDGEEVEFLDL